MFSKKKFNYKDGETRVCKFCDKEFYTIKPRYRCNACTNEKQKIIEKIKRDKYQKKPSYPYSKIKDSRREYGVRFKKLQSTIKKMKLRSEWQAYFKVRLDEVLNDAVLMQWINDRRDTETKKSKVIKSKETSHKDYPNTRGLYID